jgi:N-acetylglucosamine transport system permease protein
LLTGTLLVSSMAAYVLARFTFPGRQVLFIGFIAGLMFPVFLALVPLYFLVNDLRAPFKTLAGECCSR